MKQITSGSPSITGGLGLEALRVPASSVLMDTSVVALECTTLLKQQRFVLTLIPWIRGSGSVMIYVFVHIYKKYSPLKQPHRDQALSTLTYDKKHCSHVNMSDTIRVFLCVGLGFSSRVVPQKFWHELPHLYVLPPLNSFCQLLGDWCHAFAGIHTPGCHREVDRHLVQQVHHQYGF